MVIRFNIDPDTQLPHIFAHGITEQEVESVLQNPGDNRPSRNASRQVTGQTMAGRYLRVICVPDEVGDGVFVVTAYQLDGKALKAYRKSRRP